MRRNGTKEQPTTAQHLSALIKSARDIMRKDKGLNGDLDRLPMLTWIMFLKFLDDQEIEREAFERDFVPTIEAPYRWRDWVDGLAAPKGPELIAFIMNEKVTFPNGDEGPGLFTYLRALAGNDRRRVVATVFRDTFNRMTNGYLLRDVLTLFSRIHFTSSDEIHTLGHLYESMLKEMRDAAGDSGEFYTPRALVRFMVAVLDPHLGETVLDPACGTGGFLVEAYTHLHAQIHTVQERQMVQEASIFGVEAKPLPYLLAQMNLLLHGLEAPHIDFTNALGATLSEIGEAQRVNVILTNPPFGGEEERGIQGNFPPDRQTSETALLFLQLIMRKLRRQSPPGRAGVVVPNGTLFGDGVAARIKKELLTNFNLHTIVRLPNGVFAPYTDIPTNLLFFEAGGPTQEVWYYEQPMPEGRKKYSKTKPMPFEDFAECLAWWPDRTENANAWRVPAARIADNGYNLDLKNPNAATDLEHLPPEALVADILSKEARIATLLGEIRDLLVQTPATDA